MWELAGLAAPLGAELARVAGALAVAWPPPPPCPQDGPGLVEHTVHFAVSLARSLGWGQPC